MPGAFASANAATTTGADGSMPIIIASADIASADIASPAGQGSLLVSIAQGAPGIPACSDGLIEQRIIEPDGTAVDVGTASAFWVFMAGPVSTPPPGTPPIKQTYATARPTRRHGRQGHADAGAGFARRAVDP